MESKNLTATRGIVSVFGILIGLAGIEHGIFEILQGDAPTGGIMIDAIGDAYRFWPGASERALTIVPNFFWTGILAVIFGVLVVTWSLYFVQRKYGATIFLLLAVTLFLVGGGFAPIFLTILGAATATRIEQPLNWWREHLPARKVLVKFWPSILILFVIVFWSTVGIQIFGLPVAVDAIYTIRGVLSIVMVTLIPVVVIVGLAKDIQNK
ncbi:MAG: hypothetical protein ThorAB25_25690 [Candidatus Thorarchaeota archaeon AB_25]|nr:MAG: hypothetical protein ThorAB25_25690 [Candidatus Thorarchaeota archaeon AB_25]